MVFAESTCRWCGEPHAVEKLCARAQRGMTRRSFLFLTGAGVAGMALAPSLPPLFEHKAFVGQFSVHPNIGQIVALVWNEVIGEPADNIFMDRHFGRLMREGLNQRLLDK